MTEWQYYPHTAPLPAHLRQIVGVFEAATADIGSKKWTLSSNDVLALVAGPLEALGLTVERGARRAQRVYVPVMFRRQGKPMKAFDVDAYWPAERTVIEVEAGRGVTNNQFLKDLFEACVMPEVDYLVIAVRSNYRGQKDFDTVCSFLDSVYASDRLRLPLAGILVLGY